MMVVMVVGHQGSREESWHAGLKVAMVPGCRLHCMICQEPHCLMRCSLAGEHVMGGSRWV